MTNFCKFLSTVSLFQHLAQAQLQEVCEHIRPEKFPKGKTVFTEEQPANKLYMVFQGHVKIFKLSKDGKEQILHTMGPGSVIAEVPIFEGQGYPASCSTLENSTLLSLSREKLIALIRKDPDIALAMLALQAKRLRNFTMQIENLTLKEGKQRVLSYLFDACDANGIISPKPSVTNLSKHLGMTRENLSKILNKLAKENVLVIEKDRFVVRKV